MGKRHHKHHYPLGVPSVAEGFQQAVDGTRIPGITNAGRAPLPRLSHTPVDGTHHYGERELYGVLKKKPAGRY